MGQKWAKLADLSVSKVTPMLRQYLDAKAESGDSLLFFRMGDFYELFFEDAIEAARVLGLTLTSRDATDKDDRVPMAGVPYRTVDTYVARLIKAGKTVTICDQIEDPKDAKGVVKRAVVRTITPGTVVEPNLLDERINNYLAAIVVQKDSAGLALVDVSTGEFLTAEIERDAGRTLIDELVRMAPVEVLVPKNSDTTLIEPLKTRFADTAFTTRDEEEFDRESANDLLCDHFGLSTLKGLGLEDAPLATAASGAVLFYVKRTQRGAIPHLRLPRRYTPSSFVVLDGNTQRNLELVESMFDKKRRGSLLGVLDRTLTSMGGRKLRHWLLHPLVEVAAICARLDAVDEFFNSAEMRMRLRDTLKGMADLERLMSRLTSKSGNARDMLALGASLGLLPELKTSLDSMTSGLLSHLRDELDTLEDVAGCIRRAIVDEPPVVITDGNLFRDGYNEDLDRLRVLVRGGKDWIATLQREESQRTGIPNLKVAYNKVFGYFIEVSRSYLNQVPPDFERKQTLVNAERFVTATLKSREEEIVTAQERMQKIEYDLFIELRDNVAQQTRRIHEAADSVAVLDALLSLAEVAATKNYARPEINDSDEIRIRDGRHPVVEDLMSKGQFVPNDIIFDSKAATLQIVTGPNMAGKSTYLRQLALIVLMAQAGSFVPAEEAHIGVVDRIFTRVGASDNLARGESTFMVEMIETANILNTATPRSLIVLDEIGRGTSTFDGISIAWSVAEYIHDHVGAKTLFATHYHELTELAKKLERAKNITVAVREWGGKVVFLYRIIDGGADHSYGIQVAKLAGLPRSVISRAKDILESLESGNTATLGLPQQLYLFGAQETSEPSAIEKELSGINPDDLSPRDAHDLVCHLKSLLRPADGAAT